MFLESNYHDYAIPFDTPSNEQWGAKLINRVVYLMPMQIQTCYFPRGIILVIHREVGASYLIVKPKANYLILTGY